MIAHCLKANIKKKKKKEKTHITNVIPLQQQINCTILKN